MHNLADAIRARRRDLRLTLEQLAQRSGCAKSYISTIETGRRIGQPSDDALARLERALLLKPGELVSLAQWDATPGGVKRAVADLRARDLLARQLASRLRARGLDDLHRSGELRTLVDRIDPPPSPPGRGSLRNAERGEGMSDIAPPSAGTRTRMRTSTSDALPISLPFQAPVINSVAAGYPREFTDLAYPARVADEYVSVPDVTDPEAFAARVVGDSMAPRYEEGDIVVFSPERDAASGDDCFVRLERDGESTFKRVYFERGPRNEELIRLQPLNPAYSPRTFPREAIAGLYAAVYVVRRVGGAGGK